MTEPKLYGIERVDGTVRQGDIYVNSYPADLIRYRCSDGDVVVEIVAVKKERLDDAISALEEAEDRTSERTATEAHLRDAINTALEALRSGE